LYYTEESDIPGLFIRSGKDLPGFIAAAKSIPTRGSARRIPPAELLAIQLGITNNN